MIKRNNKKGFTIVELVIVIAVIAILAAVLIPTFAGIIKKANISADTQLCKNMNTALSMAKAEGETLDDMEDVLRAINEAGYVIENLNPTTEGYYFAWDEANDQILFLNDKFEVHYPENVELVKATCWITVGDAEEAGKVAAQGFALYLEPNFNEKLELSALVSVDAGVNTIPELSIKSDAAGSIVVSGAYGKVTLDIPNADAVQNGVIKTFDVKAVKVGTLHINGFVETLNVAAGKVVVAKTGVVKQANKTGGEISAEGIILAGESVTNNAGKTVEIGSKAELEAFRDIVNGGYNYKEVTVKLTADIDLAGIAWLPVGNVYRKNVQADGTGVFAGTFDGGNHTIKNLSNNGFSVDGLASGRNETSVGTENEVVFGLFGCVYNATIKNLTVNANISDAGSEYTGDSNAAIVGYAYGTKFTMENCKATGSVTGFDNIGGLIGYSAVNGNVVVTNCVNEAKVTGERKTAGIIGYAVYNKLTITGCSSVDVVMTGTGTGNYYKSAKIVVTNPNVVGTVNGTTIVKGAEFGEWN